MSYFTLYCIFCLTNAFEWFSTLSFIFAIMFAICLVSLGLVYLGNDCNYPSGDYGQERFLGLQKSFVRLLIASLVFFSLFSFFPDQDTAMKMIGMHYITNSKSLTKLPDDLSKVIDGYVKKSQKS